ncbi:MAG: ABC transporter permease [Eubacterium sp.]|nr:ABC transporter permease [Eubacterium sp.]
MFLYKLKELSRVRWLIGWTFLFPLVLATAFYLGFGNLISDDPMNFSTIDVGYVNQNPEESTDTASTFSAVLDELGEETDDHTKVLNVTVYETVEEATAALNDETIEGYYVEESDDISVFLAKNDVTSTTLTQILKEYKNYEMTIEQVAQDHPEAIESAVDTISENLEFLTGHDFGSGVSAYMQYFFALLAMASLYASWISTTLLQGMCANLSEGGKRFECAPVSKVTSIMAGTLAGTVLQTFSNAVVVCYIEYVLGLTFGAPLWNVILITTLGSALGIAAGNFIGALFKSSTLLTAVPLVFAMVCSFLSGLMVGNIKQIIEYNCPIVNRLNPAAVFTDCLYVLSTYGRTQAYYNDIVIMCVTIVTLLLLSALLLRRRNYDSI